MADLIEKRRVMTEIITSINFNNSLNFNRGLNKAAEIIRDTPSVNRWIPVDACLPDAFLYVICAGEDGMGILRYNGEVWVDDSGCIYPMSAITHWMPLPEIPENHTTERKK